MPPVGRLLRINAVGRVSRGEARLKLAFMPDTHFGAYDGATAPSSDEVGCNGRWLTERQQTYENRAAKFRQHAGAACGTHHKVQLACSVVQPTFDMLNEIR